MTEEKLLNTERQEIDVIIGRGVSFDVEQTFYRKPAGIKGLFKKAVKVTEVVKYTIKEPTLAVLDQISAEQIDLVIDEKFISESGINEANKLTAKHTKRMARIVALAVLGEDYFKPVQRGPSFSYEKDESKLKELTDKLFLSVKPSKLFQLTLLINTMENLSDFTNSIRLMSANRTMMPVRIGEKQKD